MLSGELYDSRDPELLDMYHKARDLMKAYNQLDSRDLDRRHELLRSLLGQVGTGVWIEAPFYCDYGQHIRIGANTFINMNCLFLDDHYITIGSDGLIGPYTQIYTAGHPLRAADRILPQDGAGTYVTRCKPVTIGDQVWIGGNVVILPGVTIGDRVTIAASSVVRDDVPNDTLVVGNPATVVKKL